MLERIPAELRALPQWVCAGPDKIPRNPRTADLADVTDPSTWGTFDEARRANYAHVGFVLAATDPYVMIDLDDPEKLRKGGGQEAVDAAIKLNQQILAAFPTYAEVSQSGTGVHLIVRGRLWKGRRRDCVEVYGSERYMICTGNVLRDAPIVEAQTALDQLIAEMPVRELGELEAFESPYTDAEIIERATAAVNGDKYVRLCQGDLTGYPSQSEADFALLSFLCFHTRDNDQVRRLFWASALGKREKAHRRAYLDDALRKIRAKMPTLADLTQAAANADRLLAGIQGGQPGVDPSRSAPASHMTAPGIMATVPPLPASGPGATDNNGTVINNAPGAEYLPYAASGVSTPHASWASAPDVSHHHAIPEVTHANPVKDAAAIFPPGLVGDIADYIYRSAVRPVPEIGLAAAIAFVAGIAGRAFNVSGTGLQQYVILVARTGTGKEGAANGINRLLTATRPTCPAIMAYTGPSTFASGQAVVRALEEKPSFFSILGEFGLTLQQICDPRANSAERLIRKVLLDVYGKSGITELLYPSAYSDKTKNTNVIHAPNLSIFGETTPQNFYDGLTPAHVAEGLVPRFLIVEYNGERPALNRRANFPPPEDLVFRIGNLVAASANASAQHTCAPVSIDAQAQGLLDAFNEFCDEQMKGAAIGETERQIWNRAHLKALKLAALVAVGCAPQYPVISYEVASWATNFVYNDTNNLYARFVTGNVGEGETKQEYDLRQVIEDYITLPWQQLKTYGVDKTLHTAKIIPFDYIRRRGMRLSAIYKDRRGGGTALKTMLADMTAAGVLVELDRVLALQQFGKRSKLFMIGEHW